MNNTCCGGGKNILGFNPNGWKTPPDYYPTDDPFNGLVSSFEVPIDEEIKKEIKEIDARYIGKNGGFFVCPSIAFTQPFEKMLGIFSGEEKGVVYPHVNENTPTQRLFEKLFVKREEVAGLNDGQYEAHCFASGMSAVEKLIQSLCLRGGGKKHAIVFSSSVYGGVYNYLQNLLPRSGVKVYEVCDSNKLESWDNAISLARSEGNMSVTLWLEEDTNPFCEIFDPLKMINFSREKECRIVFDVTVLTHALLRVLSWAKQDDSHVILLYSTSKGVSGFSTGLGGMIIAHEKTMASLKEAQWIDTTRPVMDWHCALRMIVGMSSIHERMKNHSENALSLANFLFEKWPGVIEEVYYPFLPSGQYYKLAKKYLSAGGPMLSWKFNDEITAKRIRVFFDAIYKSRVVIYAPHIAHTGTLIINCHETTHGRVTGPTEKRLQNLIRVSTACYPNHFFIERDIPAIDNAIKKMIQKNNF